MNIYHVLSLLIFFTLSSPIFAGPNGLDVIYGEDDRVDVFESQNSTFVELSKSTAAMINSSNLVHSDGEYTITGRTLQERGVCASERFSNQISGANCSGFLIAENLLVTAGHCIRSQADCEAYKWVFDFKVEHSDQGNITVAESSVYSCKKIISRSLDGRTMDDYALLELDRKTDRAPLNFRRSGKVSVGAPLVVIGHPSGLPTKIANGANVRRTQGKFFIANLDTYGGNSGSAVFNVDTAEVEGILVRGETDYVRDPVEGCQVSKRCKDNECRGEDVTYISNIPGLGSIK
jgi:V8-like Glu-specific endopeptidase